MANLNHPAHLKYSKTDEWVHVHGDEATVGITDYAQDQLGDIVYLDLIKKGDTVKAEKHFGDIESVKATSELISPLSGEIVAVNEKLHDQPELINDDPYNEGWMFKVKMSNKAELDSLLTHEQYLKYLRGR